MATIVSFNSQRVSTSALTTITPASIVGARLVSTTSADVIVHLHDTAGATSAATRVGTLMLTAFGVDEIGYPLRITSGTLKVTATSTSATAYIFVR